MKKMSKKAVEIVEKYGCIDKIVWEEWEYLLKQIDKLYPDFAVDSNIWNMKITEEYFGEFQQDGQYCLQSTIGESEDCFRGIYYFPTTDGRYLAVMRRNLINKNS